MTMPLVSICIPLYNKAARLGTVLESILSQSHQNLEVVVSDNGSDDGSSETVRKFAAGDSRIRWHRIDHTISLNENWRLVMRLAKGAFCKVHSADDPLHPEFIPRMLEPMLGDSGEGGGGGAIDFTVCREEPRFHDVEGKIDVPYWTRFFQASADHCRELTRTADKNKRSFLLVERDVFGNHLGNIYKVLFRPRCLPVERWKQISGSYPMPQSFADWDFLIRLFLNHRGHFVDQSLTYFDFDPHSPFIKQLSNRLMELAAKLQDYLMPLTILTDPTLSDLRQWIQPQMREHIFARMDRDIRALAAQAAEMDALAKI